MANCPINATLQCDPSLVKSQYSNGRARLPSINCKATLIISQLSRGKWLVSSPLLHRHPTNPSTSCCLRENTAHSCTPRSAYYHFFGAVSPPQCLVELQFQDRHCIDTRIVQQPIMPGFRSQVCRLSKAIRHDPTPFSHCSTI